LRGNTKPTARDQSRLDPWHTTIFNQMLLNKVMKYADDNAAFISGKASNDINEKHTEILVGWLNGSLKMN